MQKFRKITLNQIRAQAPCSDGWTKLLSHLGKTKADDEPLSLNKILESNGLDDALWCLGALPDEADSAVRVLVCDIVDKIVNLAEDGRSTRAVKVARKFANGEATEQDLAAARDAAWDAASAARGVAKYAAGYAAWNAAWATTRGAASAAARDAASAAASAAWDAARGASRGAAWNAAWNAAREEQKKIFRSWVFDNEEA